MWGARCLVVLMGVLASAGCARQASPTYVMIDPATGQQIAVVTQPVATPPVAQPVAYVPPQMERAPYAPPAAQQQLAQSDRPRGLFTSPRMIPPYRVAPGYGAPYGGAPNAYASAPPSANEPYTLDAGDRLRIIVFGQDGISNTYIVDAGGNVTLPLIGSVSARGSTTTQLAQVIADKLRHGYVREPHVSVEVEQARPFFILGEVTTPGQYPYVANMTVETAVAIAGGFGPRAAKNTVQITRNLPGQQLRGDVPLNFPVRPGDTIVVKERWF